MTRLGRILWTVACVGLPVLFVLVPIGSFVLLSVRPSENGHVMPGLTLDNYATFLTAQGYLDVYLQTVGLCLAVTAVTVAIGYAVALFVARRAPGVRLALLMLFTLPLFMSYILKIYSIRGILGQKGILNEVLIATGVIGEPLTFLLFSQTAVWVTLVALYLPFAVLPIYLALDRIPRAYAAASADLGGGLLHELRWIVLPLSVPGVAVGAFFTFVLSFGDFVTPQMVGGVEGFTFGRIVYSQFGLALDWPLGAALAVVLLGTALLAAAIAGAAFRLERLR